MIPKEKIVPVPQERPNCYQVLESLMQHIPGHVYWKDINGIYLGCNDRQAQSLGLKQGFEVVGKTDFELPWDSEIAQRFWKNDQQVLLTGASNRVEEEAIIDSQPAIVLSLKVPIKDTFGKIIGVLGISVDITQQKRVEVKLIQAKESAEEAAKAKLAFLENMRHDIRTPMAGIRGCIQVIGDYINQHPNKLNEIKEYVQYLDTSSEALLILLNQVLESIQAANGTLPLMEEKFNLEKKLYQVVKLNQATAQYRKLNLILNHDNLIPLLVGDGERVQRIVLELTTNALNFTEEGHVTITTRLALRKENKAIIEITVADSGIGIVNEEQQNLFNQFKRLTPSYLGIHRGAGLGLSIIKQFIDDLEGEIYLESKPNKGSKFTCVLPFKIALLGEARSVAKTAISPILEKPIQHSVETDSHIDRPPISVLLVEDDNIVLKVMVKLLTRLHCVVEVASTAKSTLSKAKQNSYELIFMDIGLPDGNGNDITTKIRQDNTCPNQLTPIVAVTAHLDSEKKRESLLAGINVLLAKPISEEIVADLLQIFVWNRKN